MAPVPSEVGVCRTRRFCENGQWSREKALPALLWKTRHLCKAVGWTPTSPGTGFLASALGIGVETRRKGGCKADMGRGLLQQRTGVNGEAWASVWVADL